VILINKPAHAILALTVRSSPLAPESPPLRICDLCAKACERSPWEIGYAESFHSRFRDEFLAMKEFGTLVAARRLITL
jgi:hypothetical protein